MDGGANCHVLIKEEYFIVLCKKDIRCNIANGEKSRFQGVGIACMELEPRVYLILAPAYLSKSDDVNTISTGALKTHSGCTSATHEALSHMQLTAKCGKSYKFMADSVFGLDYIKVKLHHFKSHQTAA